MKKKVVFVRELTFTNIGRFTSWGYWATKQPYIDILESTKVEEGIHVKYLLDSELYVEDMKKLYGLDNNEIDELRADFKKSLMKGSS